MKERRLDTIDQQAMILKYKKMIQRLKKEAKNLQRKKGNLLLFPLVFLYFEILLRIVGGTSLFRGFLPMLLFTIGIGLFFGALTSVFQSKIKRAANMGILLIASILYIVECLIRESFQMYMTLSDIMTGTGGVVGGFSGELFRIVFSSIPVIVLFLLPCIFYGWYTKKEKRTPRLSVIQGIFVLIVSFIFFGAGIICTYPLNEHELYSQKFNFDKATQTFGLLTSMRLDIQYKLFGNEARSELVAAKDDPDEQTEETVKEYEPNISSIDFAELSQTETNQTIQSLHAYVNSVRPTLKNRYTGLFKGKNLILICAEAFSDSTINEELTPTLYRLTHQGIYFSDYYQPAWGGSTSTGEYSFLMGLVPMDGVETMQETRNNLNYYTLGHQLMEQGYYSAAFHNGSYDYYDRNLTHENLGYASYLGNGNGLEEIAGAWVGDDVFFDKTLDTYIDQQPFSIYYMTLSGHAPYSSDDEKCKKYMDKVKAVLGDQYKETTLNYFCYQMELEEALTIMVDRLEEAGIADDTVICMTSDHYPYGLAKSKTFGNSEDYMEDLYQHEIETDWDRDHNTWLLWSGCLENEKKEYACEISDPTYSLDITPTLLNLFGIEYDSRLLVGRDVFSDADPLALWNDHSWITDKGKYNAETGEFIPNQGVKVDDDYVAKIKETVANKIAFSDQVLKNDYYRILFESTE